MIATPAQVVTAAKARQAQLLEDAQNDACDPYYRWSDAAAQDRHVEAIRDLRIFAKAGEVWSVGSPAASTATAAVLDGLDVEGWDDAIIHTTPRIARLVWRSAEQAAKEDAAPTRPALIR